MILEQCKLLAAAITGRDTPVEVRKSAFIVNDMTSEEEKVMMLNLINLLNGIKHFILLSSVCER